MRARRFTAVLFSMLVGVVTLLPVSEAQAASFVVNTTADVVDAGDGLVSLREAVTQANSTPGFDEIVLAPGVFTLTSCDGVAGEENANVSGDLDATDPAGLQITGNGAIIRQTCLAASRERVLHAVSGGLVVSTATLRGGGGATGASILAAGSVELANVVVYEAKGPALTSTEAAVTVTGPAVTVTASVIEDNDAAGLRHTGTGGAIVAGTVIRNNGVPGGEVGGVFAPTLEMSESDISGNSVGALDGTLAGVGEVGGIKTNSAVITNTAIEGNAGAIGGVKGGTVSLTESTVEANRGIRGGGISGNFDLQRTLVGENLAQDGGGGLVGAGSIVASTVTGNVAYSDAAEDFTPGGGVLAEGAVIIERSTVALNSASVGAGVLAFRAEPSAPSVDIGLDHSTIAGNVSSANGPLDPQAADLTFHQSDPGNPSLVGTLTTWASVIGQPGPASACSLSITPVVSNGWTTSSDQSCGLGAGTGDVTDLDPRLGVVKNNGGKTATRAPEAGSPLVGMIPLADPACAGQDQRGISRPRGSGCEPGSVETRNLLELAVGDASVVEPIATGANMPMRFPVTLSAPSPVDVQVTFTTVDGSAERGPDFGYTQDTLVIPAGKTFNQLTVNVKPDALIEGNETFGVEITAVTAGVTLLDGTGTGTIADPSGPGLTIGDVSIMEGNAGDPANVWLSVTLDAPVAKRVTFYYETMAGTALPGVDYVHVEGSLFIPAGQRVATVKVPILRDTVVESDEWLNVRLTSSTNAPLVDDTAIITIRNDD